MFYDLQSSDHHWPGRRPSQAALAATRLWVLRVAAGADEAATMGFQRALDLEVWVPGVSAEARICGE